MVPMTRLLHMVRWDQIQIDNAPRWLVSNLVPKAALGLVLGERAVGKSTLAYSIAAAVATGTAFFGRATQQGTVLVCALEGHAGVGMRLVALRNEVAAARNTDRLWYTYDTVDFSQDGAEVVINACEHLKETTGEHPVLVIIDTLAVAIGGGDENGDGMRVAAASAQRIVNETGATVLLLHHPGHSNPERARGHSSLEAAMDVILRVTGKGKVKTVDCAKMKDGREFDPFHFVHREVELGVDADGMPQTTVVAEPTTAPEGKTAKSVATAFLKARLTADWQPSQDVCAAGEAAGIPTRTLQRAAQEVADFQKLASGHSCWRLRETTLPPNQI